MSDYDDIKEIVSTGSKIFGAAKGVAIATPTAGAAFSAGIPLAMAVPGAPVAFAAMVLGGAAYLGYIGGAALVGGVNDWLRR